MQVRKYGSILFDKKQKDFYLEDGDSTDEMSEAAIFDTIEDANSTRSRLDEPDNFEVWDIEIVYRTIDE